MAVSPAIPVNRWSYHMSGENSPDGWSRTWSQEPNGWVRSGTLLGPDSAAVRDRELAAPPEVALLERLIAADIALRELVECKKLKQAARLSSDREVRERSLDAYRFRKSQAWDLAFGYFGEKAPGRLRP